LNEKFANNARKKLICFSNTEYLANKPGQKRELRLILAQTNWPTVNFSSVDGVPRQSIMGNAPAEVTMMN